jgi:hypothetical protein
VTYTPSAATGNRQRDTDRRARRSGREVADDGPPRARWHDRTAGRDLGVPSHRSQHGRDDIDKRPLGGWQRLGEQYLRIVHYPRL